MACNDKPTDCAPCRDCTPAADPVLPRCQDVSLVPGTYRNAVVTVNASGCISFVQAGEPDLYTPDPCCAPVGGGGSGGTGLPGPPGPAGAAATVRVGNVNTGAPGTVAQIVNTGTNTAAVLDFTIPRGAPGADGQSGSGGNLNGPGLVFENGLYQTTTPVWPPVFTVQTSATPSGFLLTANKTASGELELELDATGYDTALRADLQGQIDAQQAQIDALILQLETAQTQLAAFSTRLDGVDTQITDIEDRLDVCCPATP